MKRIFIFALCAAAVCWSLSSCKRDNPFGPEVEEVGPDSSQETSFWGVVGQLVNGNDITPDYKGKTFKPFIGSPDGGDESVRVVALNSLEAAVEHFNDLTGLSITETTLTQKWENKEVGSLTWNLTRDNTSWATVDVSVPAVPGLHKIIYRSAEQGNVNGSVGDNGSAYYRFGDVIQRRRASDGEYEYWICVRPSFGPEGKGDSHWVSVSPLPMEKIWPYNSTKEEQHGKPWKASNDMYYGLPENIGNQTKWHQDLAELLFAIIYPSAWFTNVTNYSKEAKVFGYPTGLPIFNDFHSGRIRFHNEAFWKNVQKQWKDRNLVELIFGVTYDEMAAAMNPDNPNARGLHLLFSGSSWSIKTSNSPKLYQLHYTNGDGEKQHNMHMETTKTVSAQVVISRDKVESEHNFPLDVYKLSSIRPYLVEPRFFGDNHPRWIVRYNTGEELSDTHNYDPQQPIPGFHSTTSEIYRYYRDVFPDKNLTDAPEVTEENGGQGEDGYSGRAHYRWGNVYRDEEGCKWFVFNQAGADYGEAAHYNERSPYSELISFDAAGFKTSEGNTKATNLPTLDQVLRASLFLYNLTTSTLDMPTDDDLEAYPSQGSTVLNILRNTGVDMRKIMQAIVAQSRDPRDASLACCMAYKDDTMPLEQPLVRMVVNFQNPNRDSYFYYWTKYPEAPDLETQFVQEFSNVKIALQDIASADWVDDYATDTYAVQPLDTRTDPNSNVDQNRPVRTETDARAEDVTNYFYNAEQYNTLTYPGSMWNEPVLFFRYTRVKDRGDNDFSATTVDGHTLTLFAERDWSQGGSRDETYDMVKTFASSLWDTVDLMRLNGQPYAVKRWQDIDNATIKSK